MAITRSAALATRRSCVTSTIVWPSRVALAQHAPSPRGRRRSRGCRSARRRAAGCGRLTSARAIATRCCWPPERSPGTRCAGARRARGARAARSCARRASRAGTPASRAGQLDVVSHRQVGDQVEELEDESDLAAAQPGAARLAGLVDALAVQARSRPLVGGSRPPRRFSSVDLPQPLGPVTATNSPAADREVDLPQRGHRRVARPCTCRGRGPPTTAVTSTPLARPLRSGPAT